MGVLLKINENIIEKFYSTFTQIRFENLDLETHKETQTRDLTHFSSSRSVANKRCERRRIKCLWNIVVLLVMHPTTKLQV